MTAPSFESPAVTLYQASGPSMKALVINCSPCSNLGATPSMLRWSVTKPLLYDLFAGAGGAARGYQAAGFYVIGVDNHPQPNYCGDQFIQSDALEFIVATMRGEYPMPDAWHASPPCQGYSIMHNLPWLRGRTYPLLILPTIELLEQTGKPYALENVMGARYGAKGLTRRGIEAHGLKAGWLCGWAFGKPYYRHRLFATNWLWLAPEHPKHRARIHPGSLLAGRAREIVFNKGLNGMAFLMPPLVDERGFVPPSSHPRAERFPYGGSVRGLPGGAAGLDVKPRIGGRLPHSTENRVLTLRPGYEHVEFAMPTLTNWQNRNGGVGLGHAKGWRLAAEAMGIDWMTRAELTQAIPPVYTHWLGDQLMLLLAHGKDEISLPGRGL